jgi:hypothetical protein
MFKSELASYFPNESSKSLIAGPRYERRLTRSSSPRCRKCLIPVSWRGLTKVVVDDALFDNLDNAVARDVKWDQAWFLVFGDLPVSVDLPA